MGCKRRSGPLELVVILCVAERLMRKAFTLIELLVVVSIISLLIALLLPALGKARDAAKTVQCLANNRQIAIAMLAYGSENRQYLPYVCAAISPSVPAPGSNVKPWDTTLRPYTNAGPVNYRNRLMECPGDAAERNSGNRLRRTYAMIYVEQWQGGWSTGRRGPSTSEVDNAQRTSPIHQDEVVEPSSTLLLTERMRAGNVQDSTTFSELRHPGYQLWFLPQPHGGRFVYLYADSHAALRDPQDTIGPAATWPVGLPSDYYDYRARGQWTLDPKD